MDGGNIVIEIVKQAVRSLVPPNLEKFREAGAYLDEHFNWEKALERSDRHLPSKGAYSDTAHLVALAMSDATRSHEANPGVSITPDLAMRVILLTWLITDPDCDKEEFVTDLQEWSYQGASHLWSHERWHGLRAGEYVADDRWWQLAALAIQYEFPELWETTRRRLDVLGPPEPRVLLPRWEEMEGALYLGDELIRVFKKQPAPNQRAVLQAFHEAHWRASVVVKLSDDGIWKDRKRLDNAITNLNKGFPPQTIRFSLSGNKDGVVSWRHCRQD